MEIEELYAGPDGNIIVESEIALQGLSEYEVLSSVRTREIINKEIRDALGHSIDLQDGPALGSVQVFLTQVGDVPRDGSVASENTLYIQFSVYRHGTSQVTKDQIEQILTQGTSFSREFSRELSLNLIEELDLSGTSLQTFNVIVSTAAASVGQVASSTPQPGMSDSSASVDDSNGQEDDVFAGASLTIFIILVLVIVIGGLYVLKAKGIGIVQFEAVSSCFGRLGAKSGGSDLPTVVENVASGNASTPKTIEM